MAMAMNHATGGPTTPMAAAMAVSASVPPHTSFWPSFSYWSRQHFTTPSPVALSLWPGNMHSFVRAREVNKASRSLTRCQCHGADDEKNELRQQKDDALENAEAISGSQLTGDDGLLRMKSVSSKKMEEYIDNCKGSANQELKETDWESWRKHFPKVEEEDNLISALKFQLEEAVKCENFQEAAKLKSAIEAAKANDVILEVTNELKRALREERYNDAARLRDEAGAGLVGWWAGLSKDGDDPFGRLINVKAAHGRFVAQGYNARQLATGVQGSLLFEVFVKKDEAKGYNKQVVYLQRDPNPETTVTAEIDKLGDIDIDEIVENEEKLNEETKGASEEKKTDEKKITEDIDETDKGLNDIVGFLKDRIPELNMKVINVVAPDGSEPDIPKIIEEIIEKEQKEKEGKNEADISGVVIEGSPDISMEVGDNQAEGEGKAVNVRVVIGGASPTEDNPLTPAVRVPATIDQKTKDSFVLQIDSATKDVVKQDPISSLKVARVATRASADQMPDDVAKMLWNVEKVPVQVSKDLKDIIKLAVSQAQRRHSLPKATDFHRIDVTGSSDPLNGLYIGAFGANTPEILQVRRKYGHWDTQKVSSEGDKLNFYEYVEAVKLTGDLNVPAGQVSFRAKIGRESRLSPQGVYPEELGVIARYKGQGQLADPGFKNPRWTDGELVLLDGKRNGPSNGAKLGFVFCLPDHHFLILFDQLNLKD